MQAAIGKAFLFSSLFLLFSCTSNPSSKEPVELTEEEKRLPENATRGLTLAEGVGVTLFASEPMLKNPTNMDIDAYGRVWICEAYNYRAALNPGQEENPQGDRILILEDVDGDGIADKSTVFYQGTDINAALGIAVLGNQVIVSVSPKVFIFTDEDGDGVADKKEVLFEGIGGEQHDHGIHAFVFGPDGKLYFNFGNEGYGLKDKNGKVVKEVEGKAVQATGLPFRQGMIIRCNLDGSEVEVLASNFRNNYELAVDAFGSIWQSDNDDDGNQAVRINYVMEYGNYGYTDELTGASWRQYRINQEPDIPSRHWHLNDPGVVPNLLMTGAGSPTGILVYEGDLLPQQFHNQLIHADALPNVVRAYPTQKDGAGFSASLVNLVEGTGDQWFRPSDLTVAPDGSLFIADWYDPGVGGHQVGDLNRGRIFRVAPEGTPYQLKKPLLDNPEQAAEALKNPNLATRYLAWQKLHAWGDQALPALEALYTSANPRYQARALWLLSKNKEKGLAYLKQAAVHPNEDLRITSIRAARQVGLATLDFLTPMASDPSPQVRAAVLTALRHNKDPKAAALWASLAQQYDGKDRWYLEALGIAADQQWTRFLNAYLKAVQDNWDTPMGRDLIWRARTPVALPYLRLILQDPKHHPSEVLKFFRALDFYPEKDKQRVLRELITISHPHSDLLAGFTFLVLDTVSGLHKGAQGQEKLLKGLQALSGRPEYIKLAQKYKLKQAAPELFARVLSEAPDNERIDALNTVLELGEANQVRQVLDEKNERSKDMLVLLGRTERKINQELLEERMQDDQYPEELRLLAASGLLRNWSGEDRLLTLLESGTLPPLLDSLVVTSLVRAYRPEIKARAQVFAKDSSQPGTSVDRSPKEWAQFSGNAKSGALVYANYCASCHQVDGKGTDFGPNLSTIGRKLAKEALYVSILSPDAGISFGYEAYAIQMKNGDHFLGFIASETPEELSLKTVGGTVHALKKRDILSKKEYPNSLMPSGLDKSMKEQELVDLVEYLSTLGV